MHLLSSVIAGLLIINAIQCRITCPPGSKTETIFLDSVNDMFGYPSQEAIARDQCFPTQKHNGWSFKNDGFSPGAPCNKINWYFQGAVNDGDNLLRKWNLCNTPDILSTSPGEGDNGYILLGCLKEIEFTIQGNVSDNGGIFMRIYTMAKGNRVAVNGYIDKASWYRSRIKISGNAWSQNTIGAKFPIPTTLTVSLPRDYAPILPTGSGSDSNAPNLATVLYTEEVRAISFGTASGAGIGENDFIITQFTVRYNDGCTCPIERIFDLRRFDTTTVGDKIGAECTADVGICNDCTCKQMCVHQNGIENGKLTLINIVSQEDCCGACNAFGNCLGYTYIQSNQGISSTCQSLNVGDCILYDSKVDRCNVDDSLKYDAVSGSRVDGLCSVDNHCCDQEECADAMCMSI